jgi:hypothetical protein
MWYNLNIERLVVLLTPTFLRSSVFLAWLKTLCSPLEFTQNQFLENRKNNLYNIANNGQVCKLRAALNDRFDVSLRRIYINDGNKQQRQYIYTDGEQKPKFLGTIFIYDDADYDDTGIDFIVWISIDLIYNEFEMTALIEFYKLASKRYKIITF